MLLTYYPYSKYSLLLLQQRYIYIYSLSFILVSLALAHFPKNTLEHIKRFNISLIIQSSPIRSIFTRFLLYSLLYFCCCCFLFSEALYVFTNVHTYNVASAPLPRFARCCVNLIVPFLLVVLFPIIIQNHDI